MNKEIEKIKLKIIPLLKKEKVARAGIFGSYARGEQKKNSYIDILIEIPKGRKFSLFDLVGVQLDLEKILGKKVDILTYDSIYHLLRKKILNEEVRIL